MLAVEPSGPCPRALCQTHPATTPAHRTGLAAGKLDERHDFPSPGTKQKFPLGRFWPSPAKAAGFALPAINARSKPPPNSAPTTFWVRCRIVITSWRSRKCCGPTRRPTHPRGRNTAKKRRKISSPPARACLHLPKMKAARKQFSLTGVSLKSEFLSLKSVCALLFFGFAAVAFRASATDVSSFMLGYSGEFYSTSVMHGTYAFNQIRITFDTDVFVDFYDLHLNAIAPGPYSIPLSGFS